MTIQDLIQLNDESYVIEFIENNLIDIRSINDEEDTIIIQLCYKNMEKGALKLLNKYGDDCWLEHCNNFGDDVFIIACANNMDKLAYKLLDNEYYIYVNSINKAGFTAFICACINNLENVLYKLLDYDWELLDYDHKDCYGKTALDYAKENCNEDIVNLIKSKHKSKIEKKKIDVNELFLLELNNKNREDEKIKYIENNYKFLDHNQLGTHTILQYACMKKQEKIALKLLELCGEDCNLEYNGGTLEYACQYILPNLAIKLIKDYPNKCGFNSKSFEWACYNNNQDVVYEMINTYNDKYDLSKMIEYKTTLFNIKKYNMNDVLKKLRDQYSDKLMRYIHFNKNNKSQEEIIKFIIDNKDLINPKYKAPYLDKTMIMCACLNKKEKITLKLLEFYGLDCLIGETDSEKETTLTYACMNQQTETIYKLITEYTNECNFQQINIYNSNALFYAAFNNMQDVIIKMIEIYKEECDFNIKNNYGLTPIYWMKENKMSGVFDKLYPPMITQVFNALLNSNVINEYVILEYLKIHKHQIDIENINYMDIKHSSLTFAIISKLPNVAYKILDIYGSRCLIDNKSFFWMIERNYNTLVDKYINIMDEENLINYTDYFNNTVLIQLCRSNNEMSAINLINKFNNKCLINHKNIYKLSALDYAKKNNMTKVVELLEVMIQKESNNNVNEMIYVFEKQLNELKNKLNQM